MLRGPILGTHGKVDANAWFQLAQRGGPALSNMDDRGLLEMAIATQAMGGPRAGTALTSLYQQMIGGKMPEYAAKKLHALGLVGDYKVGLGGHLLWAKGALDNDFTRTLQKRPAEAVKIMKKAMEAHGYDSIEKQVPQLFEMLGRQTTQRLVHDFLRNLPQIQGETDRILGALGIGPSNRLQNSQDYIQAEHNLGEAWNNLMFAVAGPNSENAIGLMNRLTAALNSMTDAVREMNPETLQNSGQALGHWPGCSPSAAWRLWRPRLDPLAGLSPVSPRSGLHLRRTRRATGSTNWMKWPVSPQSRNGAMKCGPRWPSGFRPDKTSSTF